MKLESLTIGSRWVHYRNGYTYVAHSSTYCKIQVDGEWVEAVCYKQEKVPCSPLYVRSLVEFLEKFEPVPLGSPIEVVREISMVDGEPLEPDEPIVSPGD